MAFNKHTWTKDATGAKGLKKLAAEDAIRKGFTPKKKKQKETKNGQ
jgi:hypothetical protein